MDGSFAIEAFSDKSDMVRHLIGASLMGVGGILAMAVGSTMLIDAPGHLFRISWFVIAPAVVATATVVRAGYPDPPQFDRRSPSFDPKSSKDAPRWVAVAIRLDQELARPVTLTEMRGVKGLEKMVLLRKGSRLSVQPVTVGEGRVVNRLGSRDA